MSWFWSEGGKMSALLPVCFPGDVFPRLPSPITSSPQDEAQQPQERSWGRV